jgi:hypothetical protein
VPAALGASRGLRTRFDAMERRASTGQSSRRFSNGTLARAKSFTAPGPRSQGRAVVSLGMERICGSIRTEEPPIRHPGLLCRV